MNGISPGQIELDPIEIDEMSLEDLERRAELRRQEEVAAILARMDAMDCPSKAAPRTKPEPYRPAASTVDAFWYVVRLDNLDYLTRWLAQHPLDAPALCKLWEGKNAA